MTVCLPGVNQNVRAHLYTETGKTPHYFYEIKARSKFFARFKIGHTPRKNRPFLAATSRFIAYLSQSCLIIIPYAISNFKCFFKKILLFFLEKYGFFAFANYRAAWYNTHRKNIRKAV